MIPLRNIIYENIKEESGLNDSKLAKKLSKDGIVISDAQFNKLLLDLEIQGLIQVSWITKDTRSVEAVTIKTEDEVNTQNKEMMEKDYESSFPGSENEKEISKI
jgi:hypothetical protein